MAFEVARVHQLICSRVEDESVLNASSNTCDSGAIGYMSPQSCSPQNAYLHKRDPVYFPCESHGNDQSVEVSTSLVDTSSVSAETESDDDGELLQCLAQHIAHSMLDEESKADTCAEDVRRSGCSGAPDISNVELSGVSTCIFSLHLCVLRCTRAFRLIYSLPPALPALIITAHGPYVFSNF